MSAAETEARTKHTPGPWMWSEDRFRGGYSGIVGPDGQEVLFPNTANDGDTGAAWFEDFPSEADAALIASAPSLLDENEKLRRCLGFFASVIKSGESWTETCEREYRAAILKAEAR